MSAAAPHAGRQRFFTSSPGDAGLVRAPAGGALDSTRVSTQGRVTAPPEAPQRSARPASVVGAGGAPAAARRRRVATWAGTCVGVGPGPEEGERPAGEAPLAPAAPQIYGAPYALLGPAEEIVLHGPALGKPPAQSIGAAAGSYEPEAPTRGAVGPPSRAQARRVQGAVARHLRGIGSWKDQIWARALSAAGLSRT